METLLQFSDVPVGERMSPISFSLSGGAVSAVVTSRQHDNDHLVSYLLGLSPPGGGTIHLFSQEIFPQPAGSIASLRRQVAVVFPSGGLVSNLKVWENLILPLEYHGVWPASVIEERGMTALARVGYAGELMVSPSHLTIFEKRLIGLARAMLVEPRLVIYNSLLGGLTASEKSHLINRALEFQQETSGRSSLFLTTNPDSLHDIPLDGCTYLKASTS
ncbi:MAG TPA: hypothetical protein HPP76_00055 [Desulfuromonadales bacterium]|nr:hypothetical protein [Desulfuromonadales bacterium]